MYVYVNENEKSEVGTLVERFRDPRAAELEKIKTMRQSSRQARGLMRGGHGHGRAIN